MPEIIPLHRITGESEIGLYLHRIDAIVEAEVLTMESHRDVHCNFFFQETGFSRIMVDFREISFEGCGVFCILPGQVHKPIATTGSTGWYMATDMMSLDESFRMIFEEYITNAKPIALNEQQAEEFRKCLWLLHDLSIKPINSAVQQSIVRSMVQVCLGMFAAIFQDQVQQDPSIHLRPAVITREFKRALLKNFKTVKSPSEYASLLNISPSYLNEVVKHTTGLSVSHWIHQEVMMEAKRLLYFTSLGVKEIAFQVGYEDHTYFSRLFSKVVQCSPGQFRSQYRK